MARVTVEDCLEKVENRFVLVHLTAERARQIKKGAKPCIDCKNKEVVLSLREIADGLITHDNVKHFEPLPTEESEDSSIEITEDDNLADD
jgi:DNA-directed RNA polymerase subunit omega